MYFYASNGDVHLWMQVFSCRRLSERTDKTLFKLLIDRLFHLTAFLQNRLYLLAQPEDHRPRETGIGGMH